VEARIAGYVMEFVISALLMVCGAFVIGVAVGSIFGGQRDG
jgi:hypothetical protein